jgi:hypothetical protein
MAYHVRNRTTTLKAARQGSARVRARHVYINGKLYPTIREAAEACGLTSDVVRGRCMSAKWPSFTFDPSQEKQK